MWTLEPSSGVVHLRGASGSHYSWMTGTWALHLRVNRDRESGLGSSGLGPGGRGLGSCHLELSVREEEPRAAPLVIRTREMSF